MPAMKEKKYGCSNNIISEKTLVSRSVLDITSFPPDFSEIMGRKRMRISDS